MCSHQLEKGYDPKNVEKKWYDYWEKEKLFSAEDQSPRNSFSIVIPPPNVTGVLHMGHALNNTMQDILCRYKRLLGENVLWMPGTDHAGIATQNVVEKKLAEEGSNRDRLGRDKFVKEVWKWRNQYGSAIINQLKRLGASCDWDRERFTMDEGLSKAVGKVFVQLYEEGLIYRGDYIINWCHRCHTALADLEVEHEDVDGNFYHIRYLLEDGSGEIVVATTRPETMLGDTAVAVHPKDERYQDLSTTKVILPLLERPIPIIKDSYVDRSVGTGALKVTPAHDPNDFEISLRHKLPRLKVIGDDGIMTHKAGQYAGLDRFECRKKIVQDLDAGGLLLKIEPMRHSVGHCYRCKTIIEPNLSKQWFVRVKPLAEKAIEAVETGQTRIIPDIWTHTYYDWMHNIRDWCISRQIWWGHRIPAWNCAKCHTDIVAIEEPTTCSKCGSDKLLRETDVLDTWFSSALWPFSTMGWPDETPLLKTFYPTSVLITGFDILFFWVARMMMMGIHFLGKVPFKDVYVHALVRDENGKKMSKSKGNVIDPLTIIDAYGTDAFRFTLAAFAAQGRDIKMSEKRVEGYRHFVNKLWNAARFSLMHIDRKYSPPDPAESALADRWILSRLSKVIPSVAQALDAYKFNNAAGILYNFVWHEFCDWYLEAAKPMLYNDSDPQKKEAAVSTLWHTLRHTLVLLHPFMPFVTEEIWHKLPGTKGSIMRAAFPGTETATAGIISDPEAEIAMQQVMDTITAIRNVRGEMNLPPSQLLRVAVCASKDDVAKTIAQETSLIKNLSRLSDLSLISADEAPKAAATAIITGATIYVSLEGVIDLNQEEKRLKKEIVKLGRELTGITKKLANEDFLSKAPTEVVAKVKQKSAALVDKQESVQHHLDKIKALQNG